jgi:hypothetical protein
MILVNLQRASGSKSVELSDFLLYGKPEEPKGEQTPEDMANFIRAINGAFGGGTIVKVSGEDDEEAVTKSQP